MKPAYRWLRPFNVLFIFFALIPAYQAESKVIEYTFDVDLDPTVYIPDITGFTLGASGGLTLEITDDWNYPTDPVLRLNNIAARATLDDAIGEGVYVDFGIHISDPAYSNVLHGTVLSFDAARGGSTEPRGFGLASSVDGFATSTMLVSDDIPTARNTFTHYSVPLIDPMFSNVTDDVVFRMYVYSPSSGSSIEFDNILIESPGEGYWIGVGADNHWSTAANWATGSAPPSNSTTTITLGNTEHIASVQDAADPFVLNRLNISRVGAGVSVSGKPLRFEADGDVEPVLYNGRLASSMISSRVELASDLTAQIDTGNVTLSGGIDGAGQIMYKRGMGTLTLAGEVTLERIELATGVLAVDSTATLNVSQEIDFRRSGGDITFRSADSSTLMVGTIADPILINLSSNVTLGSTDTGDLVFHGELRGGGMAKVMTINNDTTSFYGRVTGSTNPITKAGPGTLVFVNSSISKPLIIDEGTLQIGDGGDVGTLGNVDVENNAAIVVDRSGSVTFSGAISGTGTLTKTGDGILVLTGENAYEGGTTVRNGTLAVQADGSLGAVPGSFAADNVTLNGGTLKNHGASVELHSNRGISIGSQGGTVEVDDTTTFTVLGAIAGADNDLTKTGEGTLVLGPAAFSVRQLQLAAGELAVDADATISTSGGSYLDFRRAGGQAITFRSADERSVTITSRVNLATDVTLGSDETGDLIFTGQLDPGGGAKTIIVNNETTTFRGAITGASSPITKAGPGTLVFANISYDSKPIVISQGTLQVGEGGEDGTLGDVNVTNNAALVVNRSGELVITGAISGTGSLTQAGPGTLTLTGNNSYSGGTTVTGGILRGNTSSLRNNILNNATVIFDQSAAGSYSGALSGTGRLVKLGDGSLGLTGNNSHAGGTTVAGGFLQISSDARLGAIPGTPTVNLTLDGGGVKNSGGALVSDANRTIYLGEGGGWFTSGWSSPTTLNGQITGPGTFTANNDNGPVVLANPANDYAGNTVIGGTLPGAAYNNARLCLGASEVIPHGLGKGGLVFNASAGGTATLDVNGHTETVNSLSAIGAGASVIDNTTDNGVLRVTGGSFPGIIRNTGGTLALEKLGDGTLTLTGANTYAGGTTISGGTLMVENAAGSGTGSGPVNVGPVSPGIDAILGGTGTIAGTVTIHSGGMHAPGASVGEQAIGGAIWNPGGMFQFEINGTAGIAGGDLDGLGWDLVTIDDGAGTGKLDLTGLSAADPFEIHVVSLDGAAPGAIANFNPTVPYDWVFVTYDELVDDYFHPSLFVVNASGFSNGMGQGHFTVTQMAGGLAVSFIPEPGTAMLAALGLLTLLGWRKRR